jgi:hypothetical protein
VDEQMEVIDVEDQISISIDDGEISDAGSVADERRAPREQIGFFAREG